MTIRTLLSACFYIALGFQAPADAQFIKEGSIGKPPVDKSEAQSGACAFRPLSKMKGERLLFLLEPKSLQKYGYEFKGGTGEFGRPTYREATGRIGVLTDIAAKPSIVGREEYTVQVTMEDNQQVYTRTFSEQPESIEGVAFISDLECAKKQLLGKTIWYIGADAWPVGIQVYDEATDKTTKLDLPKPVRLQVKEVVAGWFEYNPVRLIVVTDSGLEAFVDTSLSGINVLPWHRQWSKFEDLFTLEDPRRLYNWPESVWQAIRERKVAIGMTQQQVAFSWGKPFPDDIRSTVVANGKSEQWHYKAQSLYFENGILTAVQDN